MEVLRVYVNVTGCHEVVSGDRTVRMLPFEGTCDGPFFKGTILSGGVDTQKGYADTVPSIITDSPCLKWLENAKLRGRLEFPEGRNYLVMSKLPGIMSCAEEYMRQPEILAEALTDGLKLL